MAEAKVSTKAPTTKKSKGDKEREVVARVKEIVPQWDNQKVDAFCAEHNYDLEKIHPALDGSFEHTGHQPDDWQVMTKKEQKPKRGGGGGSREPRENRPREDRPKGERGAERGGDRGRGRGGGESRGRGRGGTDRGGRGGRGGRDKEAATDAAPTAEPVADAWGTAESQSTNPAGGFTQAASAEPETVPARAPEPVEKVVTWAEKFASQHARKSKVVSEISSAEAFAQQSQQILGPAIVHTQPAVQQPQAGTSYRAALQGNSRWAKKAEPVVDTSMVAIEQQTSALAIDSFQQTNYQAVEVVQQTLTSDVLNAIAVQETSSFPQAEVFQPEPTFQAPPQADSFQIYQTTQTQASAVQTVVADPKVIQSSQPTAAEFSNIPHGFAPDHNPKLVIDLLSATNSVILPHSEPLSSYGIEFGSFGQSPQPTTFASQAEPAAQPEQLKVPAQQPIEQVPTEPQAQLSQTAFASDLRDDTLPAKQSTDNTASSQFSQNPYYQSQNQSQVPPQSQAQQPAGFRGPPATGGFDGQPHYAYGGFPYENQPYYNEFAARDSQPQSYQYNDQYPSSGFRGAAAAPSGGNRRSASNTNQPYYTSPPGRGGLLNTSDGSGSASPPTSEAELSPNSKSGSFANKGGNFAGKQPFNNPATKMPQIPPYNAKPTGVPASTNYNKPPAASSQPASKSFKANQPQGGSQSQQHHPDPHYMPYPPGMYGYPYPYPYQPPVMHQMPYGGFDPRYGYPYPGPVQSFEGEFEFPKGPAHYSEGGNTPRSGEWAGNAEGQKASNASSANSSAPSTNALPSSMSAAKSTVAPGGANKKPARFEYAEQDPHYNSGYGFSGAPASSPMAMHAAAAPYQPTNYGQPIMHQMGGQAPYNPQFESHRGGYNSHGGNQSWQ